MKIGDNDETPGMQKVDRKKKGWDAEILRGETGQLTGCLSDKVAQKLP